MIDAVLSYHLTPGTCGTAKFNLKLAQQLGVPCYQVESKEARRVKYPLLSLRHHECPLYGIRIPWESFDLFLHEWVDTEPLKLWFRDHHPMRIFAGNAEIARHVSAFRPDVIEAFCPSTIDGNPHRGEIDVLTFGMAHKIQPHRYEQLKDLLDATGKDYTVSVSTAIHEGSPWDQTAAVGQRLSAVFGRRLRVLGYLGDDALAAELHRTSAVALFFDPAVRANNTTFWAAVESGRPVITNMDADSPIVGGNVSDIDTLHSRDHCAWRGYDWNIERRRFPDTSVTWKIDHPYTWEALKETLCAK